MYMYLYIYMSYVSFIGLCTLYYPKICFSLTDLGKLFDAWTENYQHESKIGYQSCYLTRNSPENPLNNLSGNQ